MDKLIILQNFKVDVPQGKTADGKDKPPKTVQYLKGMVLNDDEVPEGQTAQDWIEKELAGRPTQERADLTA